MIREVEQLPFWGFLSDREKEFVGQNASLRSFEKGELIKGGRVACLGMIYILSGGIKALMISGEGREVTLFRVGKGDACILSASCVLSQITFETEMRATEDTSVVIINAGAYEKLMSENVNVRCFSYELATERSSAVIWALQEILFSGFDRRLARFLLSECEKSGGGSITMSKEAIAREVNTAREVVSRMLRQFEDDGLIAMNRKTVTVLDKNGLQKLL